MFRAIIFSFFIFSIVHAAAAGHLNGTWVRFRAYIIACETIELSVFSCATALGGVLQIKITREKTTRRKTLGWCAIFLFICALLVLNCIRNETNIVLKMYDIYIYIFFYVTLMTQKSSTHLDVAPIIHIDFKSVYYTI